MKTSITSCNIALTSSCSAIFYGKYLNKRHISKIYLYIQITHAGPTTGETYYARVAFKAAISEKFFKLFTPILLHFCNLAAQQTLPRKISAARTLPKITERVLVDFCSSDYSKANFAMQLQCSETFLYKKSFYLARFNMTGFI